MIILTGVGGITGKTLIKALFECMPVFPPIPRLHRNRQTPADSLLGRGSTPSEHATARVQSTSPLTPLLKERGIRFGYVNSINASGFCSAIRNKATAGPLGLRLPCSQS